MEALDSHSARKTHHMARDRQAQMPQLILHQTRLD